MLAAKGTSVLRNVYMINRGYEQLAERLAELAGQFPAGVRSPRLARGAPEARRFSVFYFKEDRLIAVDSVNRAPDHIAARKLLDAGKSPTFAQAGDEAFGLAGLLK